MNVRFGVFAPQGWRLDLTEIADPVDQFEAMSAVARAADDGPWDSAWLFDHMHTVPQVRRESTSRRGSPPRRCSATPAGSTLDRW